MLRCQCLDRGLPVYTASRRDGAAVTAERSLPSHTWPPHAVLRALSSSPQQGVRFCSSRLSSKSWQVLLGIFSRASAAYCIHAVPCHVTGRLTRAPEHAQSCTDGICSAARRVTAYVAPDLVDCGWSCCPSTYYLATNLLGVDRSRSKQNIKEITPSLLSDRLQSALFCMQFTAIHLHYLAIFVARFCTPPSSYY